MKLTVVDESNADENIEVWPVSVALLQALNIPHNVRDLLCWGVISDNPVNVKAGALYKLACQDAAKYVATGNTNSGEQKSDITAALREEGSIIAQYRVDDPFEPGAPL